MTVGREAPNDRAIDGQAGGDANQGWVLAVASLCKTTRLESGGP